jgi:hypothetical protein
MFPYTMYMDKMIRHYTWFLIVFTIYLGNFISTFFRAKVTIQERQTGILVTVITV